MQSSYLRHIEKWNIFHSVSIFLGSCICVPVWGTEVKEWVPSCSQVAQSTVYKWTSNWGGEAIDQIPVQSVRRTWHRFFFFPPTHCRPSYLQDGLILSWRKNHRIRIFFCLILSYIPNWHSSLCFLSFWFPSTHFVTVNYFLNSELSSHQWTVNLINTSHK